MNKLIAAASLQASKTWINDIKPVVPLKRKAMSSTVQKSINEAALDYVQDVDCNYAADRLIRAFRAGACWEKDKLAAAFELMEKLLDKTEGDDKDSIEEFLNT